MTECTFFVPGSPVPQGSMVAMRAPHQKFARVLPSNRAKLGEWRAVVKLAAAQHWRGAPRTRDAAVEIRVTFHFQRPRSSRKRQHVTTKPDLDKLIRGVLDALTGVVFEDDSQVVSLVALKCYAPIVGVAVSVHDFAQLQKDYE